MDIYKTELEGVVIIEPSVFNDERGSFEETWNHEIYNKVIPGLLNNFVQDNESVSKKGVLRGFHWQSWPMQQSKLVRCVHGRIFDIVICLIKNSPNFGKYIGVELSGENKRQIFIPRGYAHGFIAFEDDSIVNYKVDQYWSKAHECCLNPNEIDLSVFENEDINNIENFIISSKDLQGLTLEELSDDDLFFDNTNIVYTHK